MIINFNFSTFDVRLWSRSQDAIRLSGLASAAETRAHLISHCQQEFPKNSSLQSKVVLDMNRLCNNSVCCAEEWLFALDGQVENCRLKDPKENECLLFLKVFPQEITYGLTGWLTDITICRMGQFVNCKRTLNTHDINISGNLKLSLYPLN